MDTLTQKVMALDIKNLTQEELDWLHTLYNKAQRIRNAEFYKLHGITKGDRS